MSRFWLTYRKSGRLLGVVILDSSSLLNARKRAAADQIDIGGQFASGNELDAELAALVPASAIGRMLNREEIFDLIKRFDRGIPKRPQVPSIKRPTSNRRRA